ncbi:hypothetical protein AAVH_31629 [Aphelenchoides avenae]|nr:hypothetical protein AAVH_31629 [Aphelenchus avenae]
MQMHFTTTALLALFLIYNAAASDSEADTAAHGNWDPIKHVVKIEESLNIKTKTAVEVGRYELAEEPVLVQFDRQSCSKDGLKDPSCLFYVTKETIEYNNSESTVFKRFKQISDYVDGKKMGYFCSEVNDYADFHLFVSGTIVNFRSGTQQSQPAFNVTRHIASDGNKAPFIYLAKYDPCPEGSVNVGGVYDRDKGTPDKDRVYEKTECPVCECKKDSALP